MVTQLEVLEVSARINYKDRTKNNNGWRYTLNHKVPGAEKELQLVIMDNKSPQITKGIEFFQGQGVNVTCVKGEVKKDQTGNVLPAGPPDNHWYECYTMELNEKVPAGGGNSPPDPRRSKEMVIWQYCVINMAHVLSRDVSLVESLRTKGSPDYYPKAFWLEVREGATKLYKLIQAGGPVPNPEPAPTPEAVSEVVPEVVPDPELLPPLPDEVHDPEDDNLPF